MPDRYSIRYLPVAVDDLLSIYDWIAGGSAAKATAFSEKIDKRISSLVVNPLLGCVPKQEKLKAFGYRVLVIDSYLVFYIVRGHIIEIHRVIHGSRHLDDLF